jgi:RHS repeat-associated protein
MTNYVKFKSPTYGTQEMRFAMHPKSGRRIGWLFAAMSFAAATSAWADMGRTAGSWGVSPSGAATYSIPLWVQPGPKGVQPSLGFVYNSQAGNGTMGVGWSLAGFGSIDRCPQTIAEDGQDQAVNVNASDRFCLNGNKLRITSGPLSSYGTAGAVYQTEIATFDRVTTVGSTSGGGPLSFLVHAKNGLIYEYGNTTDSRVILSGTEVYRWLLNKVKDRNGNSYTIAYTTNNAVGRVPLTVQWGPTAANGSTYQYQASFVYSNKTASRDIVFARQGSTNVVTTQRLDSVAIGYSASGSSYSTKRQYQLTYESSPTTSQSRLTQILECATSTSVCLKPTVISYQNGSAGVSSTASSAATGTAFIAGKYDFNGDGRSDIAYFNGSTWRVAFSNGSGFGTGVDTGITGSTAPLAGRFTSAHQDSFLFNNAGTWSYVGFNGVSFTTTSTGTPVTTGTILTDYNGDGLMDFVWSSVNNGIHTGFVNLRLNTTAGAATVPAFSTTVYTPFTVDLGPRGGSIALVTAQSCPVERLCDLNGDGAADLLAVITTTFTCGGTGGCTPVSTGYDLLTSGFGYYAANGVTNTVNPYVGLKFNDDRCIDTIKLTTTTMRVSGCGSGAVTNVTIPAQVAVIMDWDGDGNSDLLVNNGGTFGVYRSRGSTSSPFDPLLTTTIPYSSSCFPVDVDGDHLDELACATSTSVSYFTHNGGGSAGSVGGTNVFATQIPDLAISITDGYGIAVSPAYISTAQSNYTKSATVTTLPLVDATEPIIAVGKLTVSDGIGGSYDLNYSYKGARRHAGLAFASAPGTTAGGSVANSDELFGADGRSAGFEEVDVVDSRDGVKQTMAYEQLFPLVGRTKKAESFQADSTTISSSTITNLFQPLDSTTNNQRYFTYVSEIATDEHEVGSGTINGALITRRDRTIVYDDFTYGNPSTDTTVVTDKDSASAFADKTWTTKVTNVYDPALTSNSDWCIGFVNKTTVDNTSTAPGVAAVTRTVSFASDTADPSKCRVKTKTIEPLSDKYKVAETYEYDAFGNISKSTAVGREPGPTGTYQDMAARVTQLDWGTTGQFPASVLDPTGDKRTFVYNFDVGTLDSAADPNSTTSNVIKTSYVYDEFTRKTRETRADGTYTSWSYDDCATNCVYGTHRLTLAQIEHDAGGAVITDKFTYMDALDRPFVTRSRLLNGTTWDLSYQWVETQYDALGRVVKQYMPCTSASATASCRSSAVTNTYDLLGRLTQSSRPQTEHEPAAQTTTYAYAGRTQTVTDPLLKVTTRIVNVDSSVRVIQDANNYAVSFSYDAAGTVTSITDSAQPAARLSGVVNEYGIRAFQVAGTDSAAGHFTRSFDSFGDLVQWTDAKSQQFFATYDGLSRTLSRTEGGTQSNWVWGHDETQFNRGQLASVQSTAGGETYQESYLYDNRSRLSKKTIAIPGQGSFDYDYGYEPVKGWLDTLMYPTSTSSYRLTLKYGYQNGLLQSVSDVNDSSKIFWTAKSSNAWGQNTVEVLGNEAGGNAITTTRVYDSVTARLSSITSGFAASSSGIQSLKYLYDLVGNVTQRQNAINGMTENLYYGSQAGGNIDKLYRLEHSDITNGSTTVQNLALTYDASGNILTKDEATDPAGLMPQTITWTEYNYPKRIDAAGSAATFSYGPDRQRWRMIFDTGANHETTYYIGGLLEMVSNSAGTTYRHSIVAGGRVVAMVYRTGTQLPVTRYVLNDHQGSAESFVDDGSGVITRASFTAYGRRRDATSWAGDPANRAALDDITRQGYTFQTVLGSMGLNHMNGRVQDAITGRFISADPYLTDPGYTQNYNRYSYVYNNPLTFRDPTGFGSGPNQAPDNNPPPLLSLPVIVVTHDREHDPWKPDTGADKPDDDRSGPCSTPWGAHLTDDACQIVTAQVGLGSAIADSRRAEEDAKHKYQAPQKDTGCKRETMWGKTAEIMDTTSLWSSRVAIVSGAGALVTSETVVGGVGFGIVASFSEGVSWVTAGAAAGANYFDNNMPGLKLHLIQFGISIVVPRGLQAVAPASGGFGGEARKKFGEWLAGLETDVIAEGAETVLCP